MRTEILREPLCSFSEDYYYGWYNTDDTIPSSYFDPDPNRENKELKLPFTYLHRESDEAYLSMGIGQPLREVLEAAGFGDTESVE
jgi:hypothetical protein